MQAISSSYVQLSGCLGVHTPQNTVMLILNRWADAHGRVRARENVVAPLHPCILVVFSTGESGSSSAGRKRMGSRQ